MLLINAIKKAQQNKDKPASKVLCNSVNITDGEKPKSKHRARQSKRPGMSTLQRKFTVKNKRESDSLIVYNEDYKDQMPRKRNTINSKTRISASRRSGKESKNEGRMSSRKPLKTLNATKQSHKRSQSLNKSTIEQRYRSVPQNGYNYEGDQPKKPYIKKKLNGLLNNRTPQVNYVKNKGDNQLDLSLRNAKKNLQNYFRENGNPNDFNSKKFTSLTGREKGNTLLRKVFVRKEPENPANISFQNMVNNFLHILWIYLIL